MGIIWRENICEQNPTAGETIVHFLAVLLRKHFLFFLSVVRIKDFVHILLIQNNIKGDTESPPQLEYP